LKEFEGSAVQVLDGRYGPYITDGSKNANLPKDTKADDLTLERALALLAEAPERKGRSKGRGAATKAAPKKAAAKKAATKKAAPKKAAAKKAAAKKSAGK
jgi:DNA topoisomerase-1